MYRNVVVETLGEPGPDEESDGVITLDDDLLKAEWQEVADRKIEISDLHCQIKKAKSRVERARRERDSADNSFMSVLRPTQLDSTSLNTILSINSLQAHFQRMQTTRDAYQQHDLVLENLEHNLVEIQDKLDVLHRRLINTLRHSMEDGASPKTSLKTQAPEQSQSDILKGLEIEPATLSNPLYQELLLAIRSIGSARKDRVELFARKARLEEQKRFLMIFAKQHPATLRCITPLENSDLEFLDRFEMEERRVSAKMRDWRKQVERLTQLLWERNLIPQSTSLKDVQSWYPEEFSVDADLGHDNAKTENTQPRDFAILLSNPSYLLDEDFPITAEASLKLATSIPEGHPRRSSAIAAAAKEVSLESLISDAEDTPNFINRWLLHSLRTSRLEVGALFSSYLQVAKGNGDVVNIEKWQWDVLHNWWEDESHMRTLEYFRPAPTSWISATPSPPSWMSEPFLYTWDSDASDLEFEITEFKESGGTDKTESQASGDGASLVTSKDVGAPMEPLFDNNLSGSIEAQRSRCSTLAIGADAITIN